MAEKVAAGKNKKAEDPSEDGVVSRNISFLGDVKLRCVVEFGRADVTIRDILKWKIGSIIRLDKAGFR